MAHLRTISFKIAMFLIILEKSRYAGMAYKNLRSMFHDPREDYLRAYESRVSSEFAVDLGIEVAQSPAFFLMVPDLTMLCVKAARLDKEIYRLTQNLPAQAVQSYRNSCLIDEIVLTNEIEGVHSTRREINEILENLRNNDRRGRFVGIVAKYRMLESGESLRPRTCGDVRNIYNELVLDEVLASDSRNIPDGEVFRKGPVSVCDGSGRVIHQGIEPEAKIIELMTQALALLARDDVDVLVRLAIFHFLFAYIHPFYDGNGRTNRFISSSEISAAYEPLVGLQLSYSVKKEINKYYKSFEICEHPLNKGDLTPFAIAFSEIVVDGMKQMRENLREKEESYKDALARAESVSGIGDDRSMFEFYRILVSAKLFALYGATVSGLAAEVGVSEPTVYSRLKKLKEKGFVEFEKVGKRTYYRANLDRLFNL